MFQSLEGKQLPDLEVEIQSFWEKDHIFSQSLQNRQKNTLFSFFDGPPFATGLPHYGHILASTIKDVVGRYKTMQGYYVPRRFGWDCHGLPVENEIEKKLDLKGAYEIERYGIDKFNQACQEIVLRYSAAWKEVISRIGRWVDFDQTYLTMNFSYMESVWWVFSKLYEKGLVYRGYKVMPYSAKLGTPLSNFEANLNYKDVDDPSIIVSFALKEDPSIEFLVWTTTPWTLPSNLALCVGRNVEYVKIKVVESNKTYILAKNLLGKYAKQLGDYDVLEFLEAKDLEGISYTPLFNYFKDQEAFKVLVADFVSDNDGTGVVHMAPGFGEDDFMTCKAHGIEPVCPVDENCHFTQEIFDYTGLFVKDADKEIISKLKADNKLFLRETIRHRYPFCWRTDTPLIYRATTSWFVAVEKIKDKLIAANEEIYWMPSHIKKGRFGKWLEGARDWAISRNRYWGTPIPLWEAEDGECLVISSAAQLEELTGEKVDDLHRHHIDNIEIKDSSGKVFKRTFGVFDCWFESGSMPYAQNHYPFKNKELFEKSFPADFIAEGLDQTRGWFYTLTVLGAALFDQKAFKNIIVNGIILAENGQKMSKRLKNYPDPMKMVQKYGADALRLYLLSTPVVKGEDMRFKEHGLEQIFRQTILPLWNAHNFFITYVNIYNWSFKDNFRKPKQLIDRWIVSKFNSLIHQIERSMDLYDLSAAIGPIIQFIDELTNWYIRRSRRRFWNSESCPDRDEAFSTLYMVIIEFCKCIAPFTPFISDTIYRNLADLSNDHASVHLCDYCVYQKKFRDLELEKDMQALQTAVSLGHALRKEHKLKVRQPLSKAHLAVSSKAVEEFLSSQEHLLKEELNIKEIIFHKNEEELVELKLIPNFRVLGKRVGPLMKQLQSKIKEVSSKELKKFLQEGQLTLEVEGQDIELTQEDIEITRSVKGERVAANEGLVTIALDTTLNESLIIEGFARELVSKIQTMRRDLKLDKTDRIKLFIHAQEKVLQAYEKHKDYIDGEVLALEVHFEHASSAQMWDINGEETAILIQKTVPVAS